MKSLVTFLLSVWLGSHQILLQTLSVSLSFYRTYLYGRGHMKSIYRTLSLQRVSHEVYKEF